MCARLKPELTGRTLIIEMQDVVLVSQEGENTLLQMINQGAKFRVQGVLASGYFQQLADRSNKQVSDLIDTSPRGARKGDTPESWTCALYGDTDRLRSSVRHKMTLFIMLIDGNREILASGRYTFDRRRTPH